MSKMFSRSLLATSIAATLVLDAAPAMIVATLALKATPAAAQIEEIIVTSRKRDESIMQVPATESVVSTEALEHFAIHDIKGVATKVPGLNFSQGPLSAGVLVSLRGVGTASNNPMMDQSVALVADGMQFTQGLAFGAAMFDISQVEVLKGPQALFFGKAAPGGVISVRSKDPTDHFEASLRGGYEFEAKEKLGELIVSGPVTDTLGLRLATQYTDMDGYFKNDAVPANDPVLAAYTGSGSLGAAPVKNHDFPNAQTKLIKGTAVWEPTESFNARFKLNYNDADSQGSGNEPQIVSCPGGTNSLVGAAIGAQLGTSPVNWLAGENCKQDKTYHIVNMDPKYWPGIYNGGEPFSKIRQDFGSLELNYDLGNQLNVVSVTGFYDVLSKSMLAGNLSASYAGPFTIQGKFQRHDYTEELRLSSDYDTPVNFILGAFYEKGHSSYESNLPANQAFAPIASLFGAPWPTATLGAQNSSVQVETKSLFGQVLWKITQDLELGVGTRWTDETRADSVTDVAGVLNGGGSAFQVDLAKPQISSKTWSPEVSLTYTPTYDMTIFGDIKQAYKSGSYDVSGGVKNGEDNSFGDERVRGGELGLKSRWLDDQLSVNATSYLYKYKDLQVESNVFDPNAGVAGVRTINAATAKVYGVDFDTTYAPRQVEGLSLFAAVNWNKARYETFDNAQCYKGQTIADGCNLNLVNGAYTAQDLSGKPLLRAPEWTGNLGFSYEMPVVDEMTLRFGSNTTFSSSYAAATDAYPDAVQSGYQKTSANIGLVGPNERWTLELIGDNLTDRLTYGNCAAQPYSDTLVFGQRLTGTGTAAGAAGNIQNACYVERGRATWLRLTVKLD